MILAAAAAAVSWAPAVAAQQDAGVRQERHHVVVTVDGRGGEQPQGATWVGQGGNAFALGGPRLGVSIRDVEAADVSKLKLAGQAGVVVEDVTKETAAAKAGLKAGDVIVQFDGEAVRSTRQFTRLVSESAPGRVVKIGVMRDGKRTDVEATLTKAEGSLAEAMVNRDGIKREIERSMAQVERGMAQADRNKEQVERDRALAERSRALAERSLAQVAPLLRQFRMERQPGETGAWTLRTPSEGARTLERRLGEMLPGRGRLGVTVQELTPELAAYFGVKDGVLVATVRADSPASKAGIKAGDVITTVNEKPIADADALVEQLRDKEGDVTIGVSRDKKTMSVKATLDKATVEKATVDKATVEKATPSKPKIIVRGKTA
jgi:membrane-associated protease RseP (regulator of RpoE activity)